MMTMKGPAVFLAQFAGDAASSSSPSSIAGRATSTAPPSKMFLEAAPFVQAHIIRVTERPFDDFADAGTDAAANRRILGIG